MSEIQNANAKVSLSNERLKSAREKVHVTERVTSELRQEVLALEECNARIKKEISLSLMNQTQRSMIEDGASNILKSVRPELQLEWRNIMFMVLLGSGTFGDCYKGRVGPQDVAVGLSQNTCKS